MSWRRCCGLVGKSRGSPEGHIEYSLALDGRTLCLPFTKGRRSVHGCWPELLGEQACVRRTSKKAELFRGANRGGWCSFAGSSAWCPSLSLTSLGKISMIGAILLSISVLGGLTVWVLGIRRILSRDGVAGITSATWGASAWGDLALGAASVHWLLRLSDLCCCPYDNLINPQKKGWPRCQTRQGLGKHEVSRRQEGVRKVSARASRSESGRDGGRGWWPGSGPLGLIPDASGRVQGPNGETRASLFSQKKSGLAGIRAKMIPGGIDSAPRANLQPSDVEALNELSPRLESGRPPAPGMFVRFGFGQGAGFVFARFLSRKVQ